MRATATTSSTTPPPRSRCAPTAARAPTRSWAAAGATRCGPAWATTSSTAAPATTPSYADRTVAVTVLLDGSGPSGEAGERDTITNVGNTDAGAGDDTLIGNAGTNVLAGGRGADLLRGAGSQDSLYGGGRPDRLDGGADDDGLVGNGGDDVMVGGPGDDSLFGGLGADAADGGPGDDYFDLTGDPSQQRGDVMRCGAGRDAVDSPAAFEELSADCERVWLPVPGQTVLPVLVRLPVRAVAGGLALPVRCVAGERTRRCRLRVTVRVPGRAPLRTAANLRAATDATLRFRGARPRAGQRVRVTFSGTQVDASGPAPIRGGFTIPVG
jgi:hypothetical protein